MQLFAAADNATLGSRARAQEVERGVAAGVRLQRVHLVLQLRTIAVLDGGNDIRRRSLGRVDPNRQVDEWCREQDGGKQQHSEQLDRSPPQIVGPPDRVTSACGARHITTLGRSSVGTVGLVGGGVTAARGPLESYVEVRTLAPEPPHLLSPQPMEPNVPIGKA